MRAIGFLEQGGPEVLQVIELPDPVPGEGELRIRVRAVAVNPTDITRRAGYQGAPTAPPPYVVGMDAAGVLEEIGPGTVTDLQVGDAVVALVVPDGAHGAYTEQLVVPAESVVAAPRGAGHAEASTLLMNALTARLAVDALGLSAGDVVAVTGSAGAMGGYAVQLAKADGLTVVADALPEDEELLTGLGADVVLPRGDEFPGRVRERFPEGVDGAIDGALLTAKLAAAVRDGGTVATVRGYAEPGERGITFQPVQVGRHARDHDALDALRRQAEDGVLTLRVADVLPMERASEAHRRFEAGGVRGRLALEF